MVCEMEEIIKTPEVETTVLILLLMEYGLREISKVIYQGNGNNVLILLLMEYGLRVSYLCMVSVEWNMS